LNEVAINIRDITDKVKKGEGTVGKLLTDSETIDKLNSTLSGVNKFITKADKTALVLDGHGGLLTHTGGSKMYVSLAFQPTWDKFYLLGVNTGPRFSSNVTRTTTTNNPDSAGATSSTVRTDNQSENAIFLNAQFGKRFSNTVARLGLFETTGGFAIDQYFLDDTIKLYTEVYRFNSAAGSTAKAQVNLGGEIHLYKPFYAWIGGDDLINNNYRNVFVGAGLRFTDNDLKLFATSASSAMTK
jgi:phospholipid/cholesterol/gamma-HCH transport system substrate-binding protein